jgi:hypothetical protein
VHAQREQQPHTLVVVRVCALVAALATALQQLAANANAPDMQAGCGAELRGVAGGLCRHLRDQFMPACSH